MIARKKRTRCGDAKIRRRPIDDLTTLNGPGLWQQETDALWLGPMKEYRESIFADIGKPHDCYVNASIRFTVHRCNEWFCSTMSRICSRNFSRCGLLMRRPSTLVSISVSPSLNATLRCMFSDMNRRSALFDDTAITPDDIASKTVLSKLPEGVRFTNMSAV